MWLLFTLSKKLIILIFRKHNTWNFNYAKLHYVMKLITGEKQNMKICITGHRPNKLYGYDLSNPKWISLEKHLKSLLLKYNCTEAITGMALGVDTIFAIAVLELKKEGYDIKLHCAIPCKNHSEKWCKKDKQLYNYLLSKADMVKIVSDEEYKPYLMQKRNEYMVDNSNMLIAVWNGSKSGTFNCIEYAKSRDKKIILIKP